MNKENIKKLLESGDISGAMDCLLEELETETELQHSEDVEEVKVDNETVYNDETEEKAEDVKEVIVEDEINEDLVDEDIVEPVNPEVELAKETYPEPEKEAPVGDIEKENDVEEEIVKDPVAEEEAATEPEKVEEFDAPKTEELGSEEVKDVVDEVNDLLDEPVVTEGFDKIFDLLAQINESLNQEKVHEVPATEDKEPEELAPEIENDDVYNSDVHEEEEDVKVEAELHENEAPTERFKRFLEGVEECEKVDFKDVYPEDERQHSDDVEEVKANNDDIYPADEHKEVRDVVEIVVEAAKMCQELGVEATLDNITECAEELLEVEAETLNEFFGFKKKTPEEKAAAKKAKEEKQLEKTREKYLKKLDGKGLTGGPVQAAIGYQIGYWTDNNERNPKANRFESLLKARTSSIISNCKEKVKSASSVDDIKNGYNECCEKVSGILAELIHEEREKGLYESENVKIGDFAKKEYDVDAAIESSEMNGNDEEFDDYEEIVAEDREVLKESVNYSSIREACLLDEEYFSESTYTIQTAEEKTKKLTEQISLLLARESDDPLYEELLRTSLYAQRLQEACVNKYLNEAAPKVEAIKAKRGK